MFNKDFFPTPANVIELMMEGETIQGKTILEPSAGKGNIIDYLLEHGAGSVVACEKNEDLKKIIASKCKFIGDDFLKITSDQISHIDLIVMNPPFSADCEHILHAYNIAPDGCKIIALCNLQTVKNDYSANRKTLTSIIEQYGRFEDLGDCFSESERKTGVQVAMIKIQKAGSSYANEFEGFFLDEEPLEQGENGIMPYNVVRDLVNRYIGAVKIFDDQLEAGIKMNALTSGFYSSELAFHCTEGNKATNRNDFKKDLQKSGWKFIFGKLNMNKYATKGLKDDINKFVEKQTQIPFTMKNIYKMLEIIVGTNGSRMDKAILEVFDKVTSHHHDNRKNIEGWKTNSHYLLTKRFIMPTLTSIGWHGEVSTNYSSSNVEMVEDLIKAICYITGDDYGDKVSLYDILQYPYMLTKDGKFLNDISFTEFDVKVKEKDLNKILDRQRSYPGSEVHHTEIAWGKWFDWGFFKVRAYKKGTMHFEFKDEKIWSLFNQRVAKLKGYPLYEHKETTKPAPEYNKPKTEARKPIILSTIKLKVA